MTTQEQNEFLMAVMRVPTPDKPARVIGMDVHPDSCTLQPTEGTSAQDCYTVGCACTLPNGKLAEWLLRYGREGDLYVMEASTISFNIYETVCMAGYRAVVVEASGVKRSKEDENDNDKVAALRIAQHWWSGTARIVWMPDPRTRMLRALMARYRNSKTEKTRCVSQASNFLTYFGIRPKQKAADGVEERPKDFISRPAERAKCLRLMPTDTDRELLQGYFDRYDQAAREHELMLRKISETVYEDERMLACMRIPGIGMVNAFALVAIIGDINRFRTPKHFAAYLGLTPGSHQSGKGKTTSRGLCGGGNKEGRSLLIEAAHTILRPHGKNTALREWGTKLNKTKIKGKGTVAVARKLAHYIWHVLSGRPVSEVEKKAATCSKMRRLADGLGKERLRKLGYMTRQAFLRATAQDACSITLPQRDEISWEMLKYKKIRLDNQLIPELYSYNPSKQHHPLA